MGVESTEAVAPESIETALAESLDAASSNAVNEGIEFTHADGTVHRAETIEAAQRLCPVIGKMAVKDVELIMQLAAEGKELREKEEAEKEAAESEENETAQEADAETSETSSGTSESAATSTQSTVEVTATSASMESATPSAQAELATFDADDVTSTESVSIESTETGESADASQSTESADVGSESTQAESSDGPTETSGQNLGGDALPQSVETGLNEEKSDLGVDDNSAEAEVETIPIGELAESPEAEPADIAEPLELEADSDEIEIDSVEDEFDGEEIILDSEAEPEPEPEMVDAMLAYLRSPAALYEDDEFDADQSVAETAPIAAEFAEKLEALEPEEKEEVNEMLEELIELADELNELETVESADETDLAELEEELKEKVEQLFIKLGIEYTKDDVNQFIIVLRKAQLRVPEESVIEEAFINLEEEGTHEAKTRPHGLAAILAQAELTAQQLIGKLALFHVMRHQPQSIEI